MLKEILSELYKQLLSITGTGAVIILFIASLTVLYLICAKKTKGIWAIALSVAGAIAYAASLVIERSPEGCSKRKISKIMILLFTAVLCLFAAVSSGRSVYAEEDFYHAENDMHIPGYVADAASAVLEGSDHPKVLVMPGWGPYFESYSSLYDLAYDEPQDGDLSRMSEDEWTMYTQLSMIHPDMRKVSFAARRSGCEYVILSHDIWPETDITQCGYELILDLDGCSVYREVKAP